MKSFASLLKVVINFTILSILLPSVVLAWSWQSNCSDVSERGHLNVLTINLLFSEIEERAGRLERIADFIVSESEPVDIVLLQEVIGGPLSGTTNSSLDLKQLLEERGLNYNLRYRLANGLPGILTVGNAILSRCKILVTVSKTLPFVTEEPFEGIEIPLKRKAMMSRVKIPNVGKINIYNTHLCAFCDPSEREEQTQVLLEFIENVENFFWGQNPIILGGDFNTNLKIDEDRPVYDLITGYGFTDTYAAVNGCGDCCSDADGYEGCTYAVTGNPYTDPDVPERIDYIFFKDSGFAIAESDVVFTEPWVSDHSGVLTRIPLQ